jgi:hypothetical protein
MISIRALVKPCAVVAAAAVLLSAAQSHAQNFVFVSAAGGGTSCTAMVPCSDLETAFNRAPPPLRVICLDGALTNLSNVTLAPIFSNLSLHVDCPLGFESQLTFGSNITNTTVRLQHLGFSSLAFANKITFNASGTALRAAEALPR